MHERLGTARLGTARAIGFIWRRNRMEGAINSPPRNCASLWTTMSLVSFLIFGGHLFVIMQPFASSYTSHTKSKRSLSWWYFKAQELQGIECQTCPPISPVGTVVEETTLWCKLLTAVRDAQTVLEDEEVRKEEQHHHLSCIGIVGLLVNSRGFLDFIQVLLDCRVKHNHVIWSPVVSRSIEI